MQHEILEAIVGAFYKILDDLQEIKDILSKDKYISRNNIKPDMSVNELNDHMDDFADKRSITEGKYSQGYYQGLECSDLVSKSKKYNQSYQHPCENENMQNSFKKVKTTVSPKEKPVLHYSQAPSIKPAKYILTQKQCYGDTLYQKGRKNSNNSYANYSNYYTQPNHKSNVSISKNHVFKTKKSAEKTDLITNEGKCMTIKIPKKAASSLDTKQLNSKKETNKTCDLFLTQNPAFVINKYTKLASNGFKQICKFNPKNLNHQNINESRSTNKWFEMVEKEVEEAL